MKQELILIIILGFCVYFYLCAVAYTWFRTGSTYSFSQLVTKTIAVFVLWPIILAVVVNEEN